MRKKSLLLLFDIVIPCNYLYDEISSHISNQCEIWKEEFAYQGRGVKFRLITVHSKTKKAPEVDYKYYIQKLGSSEYDSSDAFLALKFFLNYYMNRGYEYMLEEDLPGTYYLRFVLSQPGPDNKVTIAWGLPDPEF